jgi:hypothetical protein
MKTSDYVVLSLVGSVVLGGAFGWVMNIVSLAHMEGFSGMLLIRVAGIFFPPLGAVLGYF